MTRKTITVTEACYDRLAGEKRDDESWTECLDRLLSEESGDGVHELSLNALTTEHIDDIVSRTAVRAADEVENRLARR